MHFKDPDELIQGNNPLPKASSSDSSVPPRALMQEDVVPPTDGATTATNASPAVTQRLLAKSKIDYKKLGLLESLVHTVLCFFRALEDSDTTGEPFVELDEESAQKYTKRVVRRKCYDHILPILMNAMQNNQNCSVSGTPGIGKTLFGLFLLRELVVEKEYSVAYWEKGFCILFTKDASVVAQYGLVQTVTMKGSEPWHLGCWVADDKFLSDLTFNHSIFVVHDPKEDFVEAGTCPINKRTCYILSFGHKLKSEWSRKRDGVPHVSLTMPYFPLEEVLRNKINLFYGKENVTDDTVKKKYRRFGGTIRHYFARTEKDAWFELKNKVVEVAATGAGITARTSEHKGSIVHAWVEFDPKSPVFPSPGYNTFSVDHSDYLLGSEELTLAFAAALETKGRDQLNAVMGAANGQRGSEAIYGLLFERHAHDVLLEGNRQLNIRCVRRGGKHKPVYATTTLPCNSNTITFAGREAKGLSEAVLPDEDINVGTYIKPELSNFPTYDSFLVVPGDNVGLQQGSNVGLLLQMTVSGASGLRRRPKHSVKHYMRQEMSAVLREKCHCPLSVTTFCVPSACFHPFDYQHELYKESEEQVADANQPDYQFVLEIPGFSPLPVTDTEPKGIHGRTGRVHTYTLRERCKKAKLASFK